jgi:hypothetical protein
MRKALQDQLKALDQLSALAYRSAHDAAAVPPVKQRAIPLQEQPRQHDSQQRQMRAPLTSLTSKLERELKERQARTTQQRPEHTPAQPVASPAQDYAALRQEPAEPVQHQTAVPASHQPAAAEAPQPTVQPAGGTANWSFGDLLARVPDDDPNPDLPIDEPVRDAVQPEPAPRPAAPPRAAIDIAAIARALDRSMAAAIWSRFRSGQRGFMVPSIYSPEARQLFDDVVYRYQNQQDFRANVDKFVLEFEQTLRESDQQDPSGELTQNRIMSDPGRVYLLFAHASQRLV